MPAATFAGHNRPSLNKTLRPGKPSAEKRSVRGEYERITTRTVKGWIEDPEVKLMLAVQRGDPNAFPQLVARYWNQVFGRFYRRLGDRQEAEDLTQDVFLRLFRFRDRYEPRAKFATWLYHITQNVGRNAVRSRRRHPALSLTALDLNGGEGRIPPASLTDPSGPPSRPLERAEVASVVRTALSVLGRRQRRALELHQFGDCTYVEVAKELDMTPKAAKSLLYRARNQLRAVLKPLLDEAPDDSSSP